MERGSQTFLNRIRNIIFEPMKAILRDKVKAYLLTAMNQGTLKLGQTVNLAALSRNLGVSVTPIREALSQLQQARIIKAVPNRGFIIAPLEVQEAEDLYNLVAHLEVMAIEHSEFGETDIHNLQQQQERFDAAPTALERIQADMQFHHLLTKNYSNRLALGILQELKTRVFFYEQALWMRGRFIIVRITNMRPLYRP